MKIAVLFPGQGSQKVGMGSDLYSQTEIGKKLFTDVDNILGRNLSNTILNGPAEELNKTSNTQPAIVVISIALVLLLNEEMKVRGISLKPYTCAGHSLGEFTALWYADALTLDEVLKAVAVRGALMQDAMPGAMAAVLNLKEEEIKQVIKNASLGDEIVIANYNSPMQFVISGKIEAINTISEKVKQAGGKIIILPVGGAFHSPLMKEASLKFNLELDKLDLLSKGKTTISVYQNYDGNSSDNLQIVKEKIKKQMTSSVLWTQTVNNLVTNGVTTVIEIGSGKVLTGLVKKINQTLECYNVYDLESLKSFITNYEYKLLSAKS